jgi:hypothetical protein
MATIAEQLTSLADAKSAIKGAIINRGVSVSDTDPLRTYADKIGQIGETVPETRFGVGIGNLLGTVDADGNYVEPSEPFEVNLAGVKSIGVDKMRYGFAGKNIKRFIANDVESIGNAGLWNCFKESKIEQAYFDGIEEINGANSFSSGFDACYYLTHLSFKKLKRINAQGAFHYTLNGTPHLTLTYDEIFPSLEEIAGNNSFNIGYSYKANEVITFSKVKKLTGGPSQYETIFGNIFVNNTVWNFPSATEFTGCIWNAVASYPGEIHFAAANQAAIEACEGYDYKWGFQGATIYFDL